MLSYLCVSVYLGFFTVADTAVREVKEETGVDAGKKYDTVALNVAVRVGIPSSNPVTRTCRAFLSLAVLVTES